MFFRRLSTLKLQKKPSMFIRRFSTSKSSTSSWTIDDVYYCSISVGSVSGSMFGAYACGSESPRGKISLLNATVDYVIPGAIYGALIGATWPVLLAFGLPLGVLYGIDKARGVI